ncbi:hypothetical protein N7476_005063, partial [Penicillium atrosanguineum]
MSSFATCNDGAADDAADDLINQQMAYSGFGPYHFPQNSFDLYGSQFGPSFGQQSNPSPGMQHLQYAPENTILSMSILDDTRHSPQYVAQSPLRDARSETDVENQESRNESTMLSEPVVPPLDGFPDVEDFDRLMQSYIDDLSVKKQDKALIHARRAQIIRTVLINPKDTTVESARFRFWARNMFKLQTVDVGTADCREMICHEGKPVAIREKLFKIITYAHQQCQHGGRDKTSDQGSEGIDCSFCQKLPDMSSSSWKIPRLEMKSQSSKLPFPPIIKQELLYGGQMALDGAQPGHFAQLHSSQGWMGNIPHFITTALDPFSTDLTVLPSHLSYTAGSALTHGTSSQWDFGSLTPNWSNRRLLSEQSDLPRY